MSTPFPFGFDVNSLIPVQEFNWDCVNGIDQLHGECQLSQGRITSAIGNGIQNATTPIVQTGINLGSHAATGIQTLQQQIDQSHGQVQQQLAGQLQPIQSQYGSVNSPEQWYVVYRHCGSAEQDYKPYLEKLAVPPLQREYYGPYEDPCTLAWAFSNVVLGIPHTQVTVGGDVHFAAVLKSNYNQGIGNPVYKPTIIEQCNHDNWYGVTVNNYEDAVCQFIASQNNPPTNQSNLNRGPEYRVAITISPTCTIQAWILDPSYDATGLTRVVGGFYDLFRLAAAKQPFTSMGLPLPADWAQQIVDRYNGHIIDPLVTQLHSTDDSSQGYNLYLGRDKQGFLDAYKLDPPQCNGATITQPPIQPPIQPPFYPTIQPQPQPPTQTPNQPQPQTPIQTPTQPQTQTDSCCQDIVAAIADLTDVTKQKQTIIDGDVTINGDSDLRLSLSDDLVVLIDHRLAFLKRINPTYEGPTTFIDKLTQQKMLNKEDIVTLNQESKERYN